MIFCTSHRVVSLCVLSLSFVLCLFFVPVTAPFFLFVYVSPLLSLPSPFRLTSPPLLSLPTPVPNPSHLEAGVGAGCREHGRVVVHLERSHAVVWLELVCLDAARRFAGKARVPPKHIAALRSADNLRSAVFLHVHLAGVKRCRSRGEVRGESEERRKETERRGGKRHARGEKKGGRREMREERKTIYPTTELVVFFILPLLPLVCTVIHGLRFYSTSPSACCVSVSSLHVSRMPTIRTLTTQLLWWS